jgi:hypothetical protein
MKREFWRRGEVRREEGGCGWAAVGAGDHDIVWLSRPVRPCLSLSFSLLPCFLLHSSHRIRSGSPLLSLSVSSYIRVSTRPTPPHGLGN